MHPRDRDPGSRRAFGNMSRRKSRASVRVLRQNRERNSAARTSLTKTENIELPPSFGSDPRWELEGSHRERAPRRAREEWRLVPDSSPRGGSKFVETYD